MTRKLTQDEFIARAREVHGDTYDYSLAKYVKAAEKVSIVCREHGVFQQTPNAHLSGKGCSRCGGSARLDTPAFVARAGRVHGGRFDYGPTRYVNNHTPVTILCRHHGEFSQRPSDHLVGKGCSKCSGTYTLTTEEFIKKAKEVHGRTFDYTGSVVKTASGKVSISCRTHGAFEQVVSKHLAGHGCPSCAKNRALSRTEILARCVSKHGTRFVYNIGSITTTSGRMRVTCTEHGVFHQTPEEHYAGAGCPKCARNSAWERDDLLQALATAHSHKFDYSRVKYTTTRDKVEIVCPTHGPFWQKLDNHLQGNGCPLCKVTGYKPTRRGCLYLYQISAADGSMFLGYGITNSIHHRDRQHQASFERAKAKGALINKFFFEDGSIPQALEAAIGREFAALDSGIEGFRKEATSLENRTAVEEFVRLKCADLTAA